MASALLESILEQIEGLSLDELHRLRVVLNEKLLSTETTPEQEDAFEQMMEEAGLLSRPRKPDPSEPPKPPFEPLVIEGEPLSETIIRERR